MSKPTLQFKKETVDTSSDGSSGGHAHRSPLAELVSEHLREKGLRQVDFCRQTGFDQGLLSKILSSVVNTLNVESALKLAEGLNIPPGVVFEVIGKKEVDEMLRRFYCDSNRVM
ncbi:MAG TPA: helix-turn-helix transcriptional regulator [Blastocatellia bacterium]|jgi:transcriptional regulator with XRE-family HTH domain|nr:helix-turn-helix transcriptional regulator [Blastocatellia bacterium]